MLRNSVNAWMTISMDGNLRFAITVSLYNRPDYTKQVLSALANASLAGEIPTIISLDPSDKTPELLELARSYPHYHNTRIIIQKRLGCNRHIYECLRMGFDGGADFVIHIEDDILLAKDALVYFTRMAQLYKDDESVFSVCGYNRDPATKTPEDMSTFFPANSFYPWGWGLWRDRWESVKDGWQFGQHKYGGTWDCHLKWAGRNGRSVILPGVSRVKNIGEVGTYTPSPDWHASKHFVAQWADDFPAHYLLPQS